MLKRSEVASKLATLRSLMVSEKIDAVRFKSVDWFYWATAGANPVVILTNELGIAEVLITPDRALVITNHIEAARLREEEVSADFEIVDLPWAGGSAAIDAFVKETGARGRIACDRPQSGESSLPETLAALKLSFLHEEIERYRALGRDAGEAMKTTLEKAEPGWTEFDLAAEGARQMWMRGIHPTLTLVAGESRLPIRRHAFPTAEKLGRRAMLVFCARREGLYANLTRFISFRPLTELERRLEKDLYAIEARALDATKPGARLSGVFEVLQRAYTDAGHAGEILNHHQGGSTGYLSREKVAAPGLAEDLIREHSAVAWNPSLPGAKLEDTFLVTKSGLENLTHIEGWPSVSIDGRARPSTLIKD